MQVGQKVVCRPLTLGAPGTVQEKGKELHPIRTGVISYVHKYGRYVVVDFEERGGVIKESFKPREVQVVKKRRSK